MYRSSEAAKNSFSPSRAAFPGRSSGSSFPVKDPGSALTHFIAFASSILATPLLLVHAAAEGASQRNLVSFSVFMLSLILLYGASSAYHTFDLSPKGNLILKKIDHMMIFVLIAGSYTPVCIIAMQGAVGKWLLLLVWGIAIAGMALKACWVTCPKWFSSVLYIAMGWVCLVAFPQILANLSPAVFWGLLAGGVIYTIGGVIYAMKLPVFNARFRYFGSHELFHVFVMAGSLCHYLVMYFCLAAIA